MEALVTWFSHLSSRIRLLRQPSASMLFLLRKILTDWSGKADIIPDGSKITHGLAGLAYPKKKPQPNKKENNKQNQTKSNQKDLNPQQKNKFTQENSQNVKNQGWF